MAKELGDYIDEQVAHRGAPVSWQEANRLVQEALLNLGIDRQKKYGHTNISQFAETGIVVRATDKLARAWTMLKTDQDDNRESIEDSFGDLANNGTYGVLLRRGWWMLPLTEDEQP